MHIPLRVVSVFSCSNTVTVNHCNLDYVYCIKTATMMRTVSVNNGNSSPIYIIPLY